MTAKVICLADSHMEPLTTILDGAEGNILLFVGDATFRGTIQEFSKVFKELEAVKSNFDHVLWLNGNHDWLGEKDPSLFKEMLPDGVTLLENSMTEVCGLKIWGSPFVIQYYDWAFMRSKNDIRKIWETIPEGLDLCATHGPIYGLYHDGFELDKNRWGDHCGDVELESILCRELVSSPRVHVAGHIHSSTGQSRFYDNGRTKFYNVSIMNEDYFPEHSYTEIFI